MKSLYLLVGDTFLVDEKLAELVKFAQKQGGEVLKQTFYLSDTPLPEILTTARTLPFLVDKQIFVVQQADKFKKADQEVLQPYFENPNPQTILIFTAASIDRRGGLDKFFTKHGGEFVLFEEAQMRGVASKFIRDKLKQFNKKIEPKVQKRLEELVGDAPSFLDSILNQLILYVDEREIINEADLEHFEEKLNGIDVFQLMNAIASKDVSNALKLYNSYMEEAGTDFFSLQGLLHWQIRRLWKARVMMDEGAAAQMISKQCKVSPRQSGLFMNQVKAFKREQLERAIDSLFDLDIGVKTGNANDRLGMERWIIEVST